MIDLMKDSKEKPTRGPRIKSGPNRGRGRPERKGEWSYVGGRLYSAGMDERHAHADRMEGSSEWFLGFDCAHSGDFSPKYDGKYGSGGTYRDVAYVREQVKDLAKQMFSPLEQLASS